MSSRAAYIIGAGGHARSVAGTLTALGWDILGAVGGGDAEDDHFTFGAGETAPMFRGDAAFFESGRSGADAVIGVGVAPSASVPGTALRKRIFEAYSKAGYGTPAVIDPSATCRGSVAAGAQVLAGAVVQTGVRIDVNAVVNTSGSVDHDCRIGAHAFLGPGAILCGDVQVGEGALIGAGAVVLPGVQIGAGAVVRAGAVAAKNIDA